MQIQHSSQFMIARQPREVGVVVYLMQHLRLRGRPPTNHFYTDSQANECLTTLSLSVLTQLLRLRRYERKQIENRPFPTNAVTLIQYFRYKGSPPTNNFCTISQANECLTTLPLIVFTQRNFVADFLQAKCILMKIGRFVFEAPFGGLRGNVRRSSQAHWKARSGLPISVN